jgi:hypothetical protein
MLHVDPQILRAQSFQENRLYMYPLLKDKKCVKICLFAKLFTTCEYTPIINNVLPSFFNILNLFFR